MESMSAWQITQDLKAGKRYLKTTSLTSAVKKDAKITVPYFLSAIQTIPNIPSHATMSTTYPVMNVQDLPVCDGIAIKIDEKNVPLTEEQRVRARYDHKQATKSILLWKAHLLRTVTQEKAKQDISANLDKGSTLMIMDWVMKFQPMNFHERMDDFF